jgi:hypothetical protein
MSGVVEADKAINMAQKALETGSPAAAAAAVNSAKNAARSGGNSSIAKSAAKAAAIAVDSIAPSGGPRRSVFNVLKSRAASAWRRAGKGFGHLKNTIKAFSFNPTKWKQQANLLRNARTEAYKAANNQRKKNINNALNKNQFRGITSKTVARRTGAGYFASKRKGSFLGKMQNRFRAMRLNPFAKSNGQTYKQRFNALQDARDQLWKGVKDEIIAEIQEKTKDLGTRKMDDLKEGEKKDLQKDINEIVKKVNVLSKDEREKIKKILEDKYQPQLRSINQKVGNTAHIAGSSIISVWFIMVILILL